MKWFGKQSWGAPVCDPDHRVPIPVGQACGHCGETIERDDSGMRSEATVFHRACFIRLVSGGVNHLRGQCTCCGGTLDPDPPGVSVREAAEMATEVAMDLWGPKDARGQARRRRQ